MSVAVYKGVVVDIAIRLTAEIPCTVLIISFGRIVWMVEKAGLDPALTRQWDRVVLRCAENIVHWWMVKHKERAQEEGRVSFPGEVAMPQGLIPVALWLRTREYVGIW